MQTDPQQQAPVDPALEAELEGQEELERLFGDEGREAPADAAPADDSLSDDGEPDDRARRQGGEEQAREAGKQVPLAELVAERRRRQEMERELRALRQRMEQSAPPPPPAPPAPTPPPDPEPDYLEDPKGWTEWKLRQQAAEIEALKQVTGSVEAQRREQLQLQQVLNAVQADEARFVQRTPDYYDALGWARQRLEADLRAQAEAFGYELTPAQLQQEIARQEIAAAQAALARGMSPAEVVYRLARSWGYSGSDATRPASQPGRAPVFPSAAAADRALARGLPGGGTAPATLTAHAADGSVPLEFLEAQAERFGSRR